MKRSALPFVRGVRVWLRENVADAALAAQRLEGAGAVAASVVGEEPLAVDAMIREAAQSAFEECCGVDCVLGREHLGVGQARVVIDAHEDRLAARSPVPSAPVDVVVVPHALTPRTLHGYWVASRVG